MGGHLVHTSRGASLYRNLGNGKWERHASAAPDQLFGESRVMGDFDGDGHPGFATSPSVMDRHDIVNLWKPDNTWKAVDVNELGPMAYVWSVAAADFDGDGRTDLAVAYTSFELDTWRSGLDLLLSPPGGYWERHPLFAAATRKGPLRSQPAILKATDTRTLSLSPRLARPWSSWAMARDLSRGKKPLRRHSP
jgi:hypothetical protein